MSKGHNARSHVKIQVAHTHTPTQLSRIPQVPAVLLIPQPDTVKLEAPPSVSWH